VASWSSVPPNGAEPISFYDGSAPLATVAVDSSGRANFTTSTLAAASHTINGAFAGVDNHAHGSVSVTITLAP